MIEASCHCGAVQLRFPAMPETVTDCNCSICRRYGTLWAYMSLATVRISGETDRYIWGDRKIQFHRCRACGCVSHWSFIDPARDRMGLNVRLVALDVLAKARVRHLDGAVTEEYLD